VSNLLRTSFAILPALIAVLIIRVHIYPEGGGEHNNGVVRDDGTVKLHVVVEVPGQTIVIDELELVIIVGHVRSDDGAMLDNESVRRLFSRGNSLQGIDGGKVIAKADEILFEV
jgi:hypothetical protein